MLFTSISMILVYAYFVRFIKNGLILIHNHLRFLMYASYGSFAVFQASSALSIILSYVYPTQKYYITYGVQENVIIIKFIEIIGASTFVGLLTAYSIERFAATIMIDRYEQITSYTFVTILLFITVGASAVATGFMFLSPHALVIIVSVVACIFLITVILSLYTVYTNYKLFKNRISSEMTLSQRYQLSENMRTIQFIKRFFALYFCVNCTVLNAYLLYWLTDDLYYTMFFYFIWQMVVFVFAVLIIAVMMISGALPTVTQLWKNMKNRFRHSTSTIEDNPRVLAVRTTMGQPMVFQTEEETNVYFTQLEQSWGTLK